MASRKKPTAADVARQEKLAKTLELLKKVRESKTVELKPSRFMRTQIKGMDGTEQPFHLRYYQVQGAYHLLALQRMVLGDDTGLGKTIEAIAAISHMMERNPEVRVVIVTLKSTVRQWAREIERFTTGVRPVVVETRPRTKEGKSPLDQRKERYREWLQGGEVDRKVLVLNYALLIRDWNAEGVQPVDEKGKPDPRQPVVPGVLDQLFIDATKDGGKLVIIYDEAQVFANDRTKTSEIGRQLSDRAERVYGLTATLHKSKLIEGYCIYKVIKPGVFTTKTAFMRDFCVTELQKVPGTARRIPIIVGYRNLEAYRNRIAPFYLGRRKQEVSDELPVLIPKDLVCELSAVEDAKYQQALSGVLELGDGTVKDYEEHRALVALNYCQQVVNSLSMLKFEEGAEVDGDLDFATLDYSKLKVGTLGAKEEALADLFTDGGELEGEKAIVYTRFASLVPRLQRILEARRIKSVAITGAQNEKQRAAAQDAFQDAKSDVQVVFITTAGGVGINLQMARAMVFYELPWTWGDYVQLLGRMIRIGSPHKGVITYHLMAERPRAKKNQTIDHHVYKLLREKKSLIDKVIGEAAVGALDFGKDARGIRALLEDVKADALAMFTA
jgi:SNF2 family DNA or RNA helicase